MNGSKGGVNEQEERRSEIERVKQKGQKWRMREEEKGKT